MASYLDLGGVLRQPCSGVTDTLKAVAAAAAARRHDDVTSQQGARVHV